MTPVTTTLLDQMVQTIVDEVDPDLVILFGSRARGTAQSTQHDLVDRMHLHASADPLFHAFAIEDQVDTLRLRRVPLPGGGSVVFDRTEALVAVDVNSGRTREKAV